MSFLLGLLLAIASGGSSNTQSTASSGASCLPRNGAGTSIYRSRDGSALFHFWVSCIGGDIRIYIVEFPGSTSCHILRDHLGPYICWSTPIHSTAAARAVAAAWAEATLVYQRTGQAF